MLWRVLKTLMALAVALVALAYFTLRLAPEQMMSEQMRDVANALPVLGDDSTAETAPLPVEQPVRPVVRRMTTISRQSVDETPPPEDLALDPARADPAPPVVQHKTIRVGE